MLYDLRKKPKYRPVYYVITVLAGTICPLMFFSTVFLLPKIAVIIGAVHFVLFLFIAFDKKSFVRGAETEMKKLYRIVCVIRNVLWFAVIILWFAFMLAYGSDNKIFYPIKRFVVVAGLRVPESFFRKNFPNRSRITDFHMHLLGRIRHMWSLASERTMQKQKKFLRRLKKILNAVKIFRKMKDFTVWQKNVFRKTRTASKFIILKTMKFL